MEFINDGAGSDGSNNRGSISVKMVLAVVGFALSAAVSTYLVTLEWFLGWNPFVNWNPVSEVISEPVLLMLLVVPVVAFACGAMLGWTGSFLLAGGQVRDSDGAENMLAWSRRVGLSFFAVMLMTAMTLGYLTIFNGKSSRSDRLVPKLLYYEVTESIGASMLLYLEIFLVMLVLGWYLGTRYPEIRDISQVQAICRDLVTSWSVLTRRALLYLGGYACLLGGNVVVLWMARSVHLANHTLERMLSAVVLFILWALPVPLLTVFVARHRTFFRHALDLLLVLVVRFEQYHFRFEELEQLEAFTDQLPFLDRVLDWAYQRSPFKPPDVKITEDAAGLSPYVIIVAIFYLMAISVMFLFFIGIISWGMAAHAWR